MRRDAMLEWSKIAVPAAILPVGCRASTVSARPEAVASVIVSPGAIDAKG